MGAFRAQHQPDGFAARLAALEPVRFTPAGEPEVDSLDSLDSDRIDGPDGDPYLIRYYLTRSERQSIRFHHLLTSDPGRDLHDHPWDFVSLLLTGGYRETTPDSEVEHWSPCLLARAAEHPHRLDLLDGPMWTYVVTGAVRRRWGFHTARGWVHWSEYETAGTRL